MKEKLVVDRYTQTCYACPSQWDIYTRDGHYIYARYRWGYLSLTLDDKEEIFGINFGDKLDGTMNTDELKMVTQEILDWNEY